MENDKKALCLMLAATIYFEIDLSCLINEDDLYEKGIERNPHITIFYGPASNEVKRENIIKDCREVLGESKWFDFTEYLKEEYNNTVDLTDVFKLSKFERPDCDYLILRLNENAEIYSHLKNLWSGLSEKYDITLSFSEYKPHLTLAQLLPGMASKYLDPSHVINKWVERSRVRFEDLVYSEGVSENEWKEWNLTTYHAVDRYFKKKRDLQDLEDIKNDR